MTAATIDSIKLLQFNPNRGLGFDFRRELQFSPNRPMLFDPNRALGFDKDRDLGFGKRGPVFRGLVCPNCRSLVMIIEEDCPECGAKVQSFETASMRKQMAALQAQRAHEVSARAAMGSRSMGQPAAPQPPRQPPAPASAVQYRRPPPPQRSAPAAAAPRAPSGSQVICPNCALQLPGQTVYCPRCGVNIQQWRAYLTQMSQNKTGSDAYRGRYMPPGR
jgi:RNA polymerase subunit RPABC4/transcription elongation factor Spt4